VSLVSLETSLGGVNSPRLLLVTVTPSPTGIFLQTGGHTSALLSPPIPPNHHHSQPTRPNPTNPKAPQKHRLLTHSNHVVNLQQHLHRFCRQFHGRNRHQQRLPHVCFTHVGNQSFLYIDTTVVVAQSVLFAQFRDNLNGVQTGVLRQRVRNDFQCFRVGFDAVRLHPRQRIGPRAQTMRDRRFSHTTTTNHKFLFDQRTHHAQRIVQRTVGFLQHHFVTATNENGTGFARVGHAGDFHNTPFARNTALFGQFRRTCNNKNTHKKHNGQTTNAGEKTTVQQLERPPTCLICWVQTHPREQWGGTPMIYRCIRCRPFRCLG
jgi:hypothetical protein